MKRITVPEEGIETLFGSYDENLKHLESLFNVRIRTQGHDLLVDGDSPDLDKVDRVVGQLSSLMRDGYKLSNADVKTASDLVAQNESVDLRDHFPEGQPDGGRQAPRRAEDGQPAPLPRRHRAARHRVRHRPGGHRQDVSGDGAGGGVSRGEEGQPHHPGAAGGRSGREARVSAGRPAGEGEPVPAAALRRALRHARRRARGALHRARHDRDRADRVHARPDAQRLVRHPRRGAEHDVRADEDVPDAPRLRRQGGHHGRHHADRSAASGGRPAWSRR